MLHCRKDVLIVSDWLRRRKSVGSMCFGVSKLCTIILCYSATMASQRSTRQNSGCPIFGVSKRIQKSQLPTISTVLQWYQIKRYQKKVGALQPSGQAIVKELAAEVIAIWATASIPIVSVQEVIRKIGNAHETYTDMVKQWRQCDDQGNANEVMMKVSDYRDEQEAKLLDIASCKCEQFENCRCLPNRRVPVAEREFLIDQRSSRMMHIDNTIDRKATQKNERRLQRVAKEEERYQRHLASISAAAIDAAMCQDDESDQEEEDEENDDDDEYQPIEYDDVDKNRTQVNLSLFCIECDRIGLSNKAAARILNAMLTTFGIIEENNTTAVVDRYKIKRERIKARELVTAWSFEKNKELKCMYFDGKKDATKVQEVRGDRQFPVTVREDHYCMVSSDGSFIGHLTVPKSHEMAGKEAQRIALEMITYFENNQIDVSQLSALGCDGTSVNTGNIGGVLTHMERYLSRPVQRIVCLLHANELPFRHLFRMIDGATSGPNSFSGEIGKLLQNCMVSVVQFDRIKVQDFPIIDKSIVDNLSNDQRYLYRMCAFVRGDERNVNVEQLINLQPGPIFHARWLTLACRILRLYVGTDKSMSYYSNLKSLAEFIIKSYAPVWFLVKQSPLIKDSGRHYFQMVKRSRYLPDDQRKLIDKILKVNHYSGHSEAVLLTMLADESKKQKAVEIIQNIRQQRPYDYSWIKAANPLEGQVPMDIDGDNRTVTIRKYMKPPLCFDAVTSTTSDDQYDALLDFTQFDTITEPPLTMEIPVEQLINFDVPDLPSHTQATERCIKLVTEASQRVIGRESRHGYIVSTMFSRSVNGKFDTKRDYRVADIDDILKMKAKLKRQRQE